MSYKTPERNIQINKKRKIISRSELEELSKKELIDRVLQLDAHVFQLKNLLQKKLNENSAASNEQRHVSATQEVAKSNSKKKRTFDFSKCNKRHVLLRFLYFGWDYQGLACQEDSNDTIEHILFQALIRTCLIESRATSNYHRCGRTDKGVSAFSQVISIDLRSKLLAGEADTEEALSREIDYCGLLNRVLPKNIQCVAWMPLKNGVYSARFDCRARTYRYYFPGGDLNIAAMQAACARLVSHADFRNFCKMDVNNGVTNYMRHVQHASVAKCAAQSDEVASYGMYFLEIKANAFLWHQIRCIMAILLLVGQGKEAPQVIDELLDIETNPCKPQYTPAHGMPLNLFDCEFHKRSKQPTTAEECIEQIAQDEAETDTTDWVHNEESLQRLIEDVQGEWTMQSIKCSMIRDVLQQLEQLFSSKFAAPSIRSQVVALQDGVQAKQYQKLLNRKRCESLENRIDHFVKKQRLTRLDGAANSETNDQADQVEV